MTTVASPLAASNPASVAIGWPNRREKRSIFTRGSRSRRARISSSVRSGEGSTLKISSHDIPSPFSTPLRRS